MTCYKMIGKGGYSKVITPPIYCTHQQKHFFLISSNVVNNNDVGKVFIGTDTKYDFEEEVRILEKIKQIPHYTDFTVEIKDACILDKNDLEIDKIKSLEKLSVIHKKSFYERVIDNMYCCNNIYQIIFENGGCCLNKIEGSIGYNKCMDMIKTLLIGIQALHNNNIIHRDIKPTNILYNGNKFSIIDFGLSCTIEEVYDYDSSGYLLEYGYPFHPPEFYIIYLLYNYYYQILSFDECLSKAQYELTTETKLLNKYYETHYNMYKLLPKQYTTVDYINEFKNIFDDIHAKQFNKIEDIYHSREFVVKADVFSISLVLYNLKKKISFDTVENEKKYDALCEMSSVFNPFRRCSIQDLLNIIDAE